jgi:hypothetical protein
MRLYLDGVMNTGKRGGEPGTRKVQDEGQELESRFLYMARDTSNHTSHVPILASSIEPCLHDSRRVKNVDYEPRRRYME